MSAVTCSVLLAGSPEGVEAACAGVARRLLGEQPVREAPPASPGAPDDADVLWRRWGARSYGQIGLTPYQLPDPSSTFWPVPTRRLFNSDTVVPFGVDTDVAALLEHLPAGPTPEPPPDEPVLALPAHAVSDAGPPRCRGWRARPSSSRTSSSSAALAQCFARPTPERAAVAVTRRDLGTGGTHTTLRLLGRAPMADEALALAAQLRRLRDEGPTETEVVQALDRLIPRPTGRPFRRPCGRRGIGSPVSRRRPRRAGVMRAWRCAPSCPGCWWSGPQMPALDELAPPGAEPHRFVQAERAQVPDGEAGHGRVGARGLAADRWGTGPLLAAGASPGDDPRRGHGRHRGVERR